MARSEMFVHGQVLSNLCGSRHRAPRKYCVKENEEPKWEKTIGAPASQSIIRMPRCHHSSPFHPTLPIVFFFGRPRGGTTSRETTRLSIFLFFGSGRSEVSEALPSMKHSECLTLSSQAAARKGKGAAFVWDDALPLFVSAKIESSGRSGHAAGTVETTTRTYGTTV